jgi:hypothetical protein
MRISERGRRFLADRLSRLSDAQIESLFRAARFDQHDGTIAEWTALFKQRVEAIAGGPACPGGGMGEEGKRGIGEGGRAKQGHVLTS